MPILVLITTYFTYYNFTIYKEISKFFFWIRLLSKKHHRIYALWCYCYSTSRFMWWKTFKFSYIFWSIIDGFLIKLSGWKLRLPLCLHFKALLYNVPKWSDKPWTFVATFWKCVWPFSNFMNWRVNTFLSEIFPKLKQ